MANLIFLDLDQVMDILLGEMPRGVYAEDRADSPDVTKRSYSSSEIRAHAQIYANLYANLLDIYENKFISTVQPDGLNNWETQLFATAQDANASYAIRQGNLLAKWRSTGGLSYPYIFNIISGVLTPLGIPFALNVFCGGPVGAWILDVTPLDFDTYLAEIDPNISVPGSYHLDCNFLVRTTGNFTSGSPVITGLPTEITSKVQVGAGIANSSVPVGTLVLSVAAHTITMNHNASATLTASIFDIQNYVAAGVTSAELQEILRTAFTYAVYIYGNVDAMTLSNLDTLLSQSEPGGSTHQIFNNAVPPIDPEILDLGGGGECVLVDAFDCGNSSYGASFNVWDFSL